MNVAKPWPFGETVVRAELVGVTFRGTGAVTHAKVRLVLQSTPIFQAGFDQPCRRAIFNSDQRSSRYRFAG